MPIGLDEQMSKSLWLLGAISKPPIMFVNVSFILGRLDFFLAVWYSIIEVLQYCEST